VVNELLRAREAGESLGTAAIFYRTHAQSRPLEEELPGTTALCGRRRHALYDRAEVKDAPAYLRSAQSSRHRERAAHQHAGARHARDRRTRAAASEEAGTTFGTRWCAGWLPLRAGRKRVAEFVALMQDLGRLLE
jgi:DNA helicase-2/ATP-dependent DNA helicase PcrA